MNGAYVINLDDYDKIGTHGISLYVNNDVCNYFDSFGIEHILVEITKVIKHYDNVSNIFRIQANTSIMCGYFCIAFIEFMLKGLNMHEFTNMFSVNDFKMNAYFIKKYKNV